MLTRLKVSGFKNLADVDVWFGPFTCIAGPNGAGKSNLLDAIQFLGAVCDRSLTEAALGVRGAGGRMEDIRSLFHRTGGQWRDRISFEVEMIVPTYGVGDMVEAVTAAATFLRYRLEIGWRRGDVASLHGPLELLCEELVGLSTIEALDHLRFPGISPHWLKSVLRGQESPQNLITTEGVDTDRTTSLHGERDRSGAPKVRPAAALSRTVLSAADAEANPTAFMARIELRSWQLLHLEPSALRRPDEGWGDETLGSDGSHLPGALYQIARFNALSRKSKRAKRIAEDRVYAEVANRLSPLVEDVKAVSVVRDDERQLMTLQVTDRNGISYPARFLSDGTLRFLALAVLSLQSDAVMFRRYALICIEEPDNGVSPDRIPALIRLLRDIAADVTLPVGPTNPLRQVIVTTHSPTVVSQVPDDSLLIAEPLLLLKEQGRGSGVQFSGLPDTWRQDVPGGGRPAPRGALLAYLSPTLPAGTDDNDSVSVTDGNARSASTGRTRRVVDREDLQQLGVVAPRKG